MAHEIEGKRTAGSYVDSTFANMRKNPWMPAAIVLAVILVTVLFMRSGGVSGNAVSEQVVKDNVLKFAKAQGVNATVDSVKLNGALYQVLLTVQGQQVPMYVTLDGKQLIQQPISLDGSVAAGAGSQTQIPTGPVNIVLGNAPVIGDANAKVTVVEFSDFSCPFCVAASGDNQALIDYMKQRTPTWEPIVTNLMRDYVQTGKVKFALKYSFGHSGGHPANLVGWCLNDQSSDLFWKFYPKAFSLYDMQASTQAVEDLSKMKDLAKSIGADMAKLQTCLDSKKYDSRFDTEQAEGTSYGVSGTPAFFVNGQIVEGAVPYSQVKALIDSELAKAG